MYVRVYVRDVCGGEDKLTKIRQVTYFMKYTTNGRHVYIRLGSAAVHTCVQNFGGISRFTGKGKRIFRMCGLARRTTRAQSFLFSARGFCRSDLRSSLLCMYVYIQKMVYNLNTRTRGCNVRKILANKS